MNTDKKNLYVIGGAVAAFLIITIIAVSLTKKDDTSVTNTQNTSIPTTVNSAVIAPTAASKAVGNEHEIGNLKLKLATVSGVSETDFATLGDSIGEPGEGKAYVVINLEMRYTGNANKFVDATYASLYDATNKDIKFAQPDIFNDPGQPYTGTILYRSLLDTSTNQFTKNLVFTVDKATTMLRFEYNDTESQAVRVWEFENPVK